ncbi:hypothetical protein KBD69_04015 [Candidatus Woesebacteria bacterium]|nr:hypothetical protein [Candidatus Woesebacteria bacterium]
MQIRDLYDKYYLMPQLREHQLRVGGIVRLITDDHDSIITALVHDMGNIVKFDLDHPLTQVEDLEKWKIEQEHVRTTYGSDAHEATFAILKDAGLNKYNIHLRDEGRAYDNESLDVDFFESMSKPALFTLYGDMRVSIEGVVTMQERIEDLERRYSAPRTESKWAKKLEDYMQSIASIDVRSITEVMVEPLFDELLTMTV